MTKHKYTLREAREILGLSQEALAKRSGVGTKTIVRIEKGSIHATSYESASALANALGLDIDEIVWPNGLTHLGRPTGTGIAVTVRKVVKTTRTETITTMMLCPKHYIQLPISGICDHCA